MLKIGITFLVGMWPGLPKLYLVSHRLNVMLVSIVSLLYNCRSIFPRANFSPKTWNWPNQIIVMSSKTNVLSIHNRFIVFENQQKCCISSFEFLAFFTKSFFWHQFECSTCEWNDSDWFDRTSQCLKIPKMSHMYFSILTFSTKFCPIKSDMSGNTVWPQISGFQKLAKWTIFGIFNELL